MSAGGGELVASDEPTVVAKPLLDALVVEECKDGGCLADPTSANQSDWNEVFCETNDRLDQLAASKACPRWWRW